MTLHKEGFPTLLLSFILLFIVNSATWYFFPAWLLVISLISLCFYLFLVSFFRKPDRTIMETNDNAVLSPCDGKIVVIEKVFEAEFLNQECIQVSIFMSPLNVHINWYPTSGEVLYYKYHPGKYLAAWNPKASTENERTTVGYKTNGKTIVLRQVAGALARRIVCYAKSGQNHQQGDEMGFIKFGSRVDLYLPSDSTISVKLQDIVKGNRTVIATL